MEYLLQVMIFVDFKVIPWDNLCARLMTMTAFFPLSFVKVIGSEVSFTHDIILKILSDSVTFTAVIAVSFYCL